LIIPGRAFLFLLLAPVLLAFSTEARAWDWTVNVYSEKNGVKTPYDAVQWQTTQVSGGLEDTIRIPGKFNRPYWSLLHSSGALIKVNKAEVSDFVFTAKLETGENKMKVIAVGPKGEVEEFYIDIRSSEAIEYLKQKKERRWFIVSGGGFSLNSYRETKKPDYSAFVLFTKMSARYLLIPGKWDLDGNFFLTLLPLSRNMDGITARFLGINLRGAYQVQRVKTPWVVKVGGGVYYTTMFVTDDRFGFSSLLYPQFYPSATYLYSAKDSFSGYLKYVPINAGIWLSFSERELAIGASWRHLLPNGKNIMLSLDISDLTYVPRVNRTVHVNTFSLSGSYEF
jgi:hypothetical protein